MARGRSTSNYERLYIDGYNMSGYTIDCGERGVEHTTADIFCLSDAVTGVVAGQPTVTFGPVNGVFDNTATSGIHVLANAAQGTRRNIMHVRGVRAAPILGDDTFCFVGLQQSYKGVFGDAVTANMTFSQDSTAGMNYGQHFGALLHPFESATVAYSATASFDNGAATTKGGWLMYQIYSITGAGTVTISVDDSADSTTFAALSGATSGAIATASAPTSGFVQLATTATVRQYLRWQIAFGSSANDCVFALAFMRG